MEKKEFWKIVARGVLIGLLFAVVEVTRAGEVYEFYNGVRQMGMGGAAIAVVNDETALLLNPAGLGKLRDYIITVADPEIHGSTNAASLAGIEVINMFKPQTMLDKLYQASNRGSRLHLKFQLFPSIVVPNFGIGLFGKYSSDGYVDSAGTLYELNYTNDYAGVLGFNLRLFDGIIKLGVNARAINRVEIRRTDIPANSTGLTVNSLAQEGFGVATDVGTIITLPFVWLPTLAAVLRDAGGTSYELKGGMLTSATTAPVHTPQTLDAAFAVFPILSNRSRMVFTGEYRDALNVSQETDPMRKIHVGTELNFNDVLFIRAGMNQRYWTAGLEVAVGMYQVQAAAYGEDVGTAATPIENRRYILKFSVRF